MTARILLIAALLAFALFAFRAQAQQVYRWVDAQGDVHYSQTPPPGAGANAKRVDVTPTPADATGARAQQALVNSVASADKAQQEAAQKASQQAAQKAQQQQACDAARAKLQGYMEAHRVITNANSANPTYYTGENLVKFREQAQEQVNKVCAGASATSGGKP